MRSERDSELTFGIPAFAQLRNCSEDARQLGLNENAPFLLHPIDEQVSAMARRFGRHCATVPAGLGCGNSLLGTVNRQLRGGRYGRIGHRRVVSRDIESWLAGRHSWLKSL